MHSVELEGMTVGERAQERAQGGWGTDTPEQGRHPTVPQDVQVIDAVRTRDHASHDAHHLRVRPGARTVLRPPQLHLLGHQPRKPAPLGQPHHRDQPGVRDQIHLIEHSRHR
jgi:hypothetical protein